GGLARRRAVKTLREALTLLALVMLEHRVHDRLAGRRPPADPFHRQPRVRAVGCLLLEGQRVEPAQEALGQLPESDVDEAAGHAELHPRRALIPDARADGDRQDRHPRLVDGQVVDARGRGGAVGYPEEVARALQGRRAAFDKSLELRPRERVAGAHDLANARHEELGLGEERLRALGRHLGEHGLERQRAETRHLDGALRLGVMWPRFVRGRRCGRRRLAGRVRRLVADEAPHDVAHPNHQATPTMSLITSAMIFSPISFTRLEYPTSRATSHTLLISRGVPWVKSKMSLIASGVKSWVVRPAISSR